MLVVFAQAACTEGEASHVGSEWWLRHDGMYMLEGHISIIDGGCHTAQGCFGGIRWIAKVHQCRSVMFDGVFSFAVWTADCVEVSGV